MNDYDHEDTRTAFPGQPYRPPPQPPQQYPDLPTRQVQPPRRGIGTSILASVGSAVAVLALAVGGWAVTHDHHAAAAAPVPSVSAPASPSASAPAPAAQAPAAQAPAPAPAAPANPAPREVSPGVYANGNTSDAFAENVVAAWDGDNYDTEYVYSPVTGETYLMTYQENALGTVTATGGNNAWVQFSS